MSRDQGKIRFSCFCGREIVLSAASSGRHGVCPDCGTKLRVPGGTLVQPSARTRMPGLLAVGMLGGIAAALVAVGAFLGIAFSGESEAIPAEGRGLSGEGMGAGSKTSEIGHGVHQGRGAAQVESPVDTAESRKDPTPVEGAEAPLLGEEADPRPEDIDWFPLLLGNKWWFDTNRSTEVVGSFRVEGADASGILLVVKQMYPDGSTLVDAYYAIARLEGFYWWRHVGEHHPSAETQREILARRTLPFDIHGRFPPEPFLPVAPKIGQVWKTSISERVVLRRGDFETGGTLFEDCLWIADVGPERNTPIAVFAPKVGPVHSLLLNFAPGFLTRCDVRTAEAPANRAIECPYCGRTAEYEPNELTSSVLVCKKCGSRLSAD